MSCFNCVYATFESCLPCAVNPSLYPDTQGICRDWELDTKREAHAALDNQAILDLYFPAHLHSEVQISKHDECNEWYYYWQGYTLRHEPGRHTYLVNSRYEELPTNHLWSEDNFELIIQDWLQTNFDHEAVEGLLWESICRFRDLNQTLDEYYDDYYQDALWDESLSIAIDLAKLLGLKELTPGQLYVYRDVAFVAHGPMCAQPIA